MPLRVAIATSPGRGSPLRAQGVQTRAVKHGRSSKRQQKLSLHMSCLCCVPGVTRASTNSAQACQNVVGGHRRILEKNEMKLHAPEVDTLACLHSCYQSNVCGSPVSRDAHPHYRAAQMNSSMIQTQTHSQSTTSSSATKSFEHIGIPLCR